MIISKKAEASQTPKILAVDDTPDNLFMLGAILDEEHYHLTCVESGKEALAELENNRPDLILLDVMMPEMDGYEVVSYIRRKLAIADIPILLLTANHELDRQKELEAETSGLLQKPYDITELVDRVQNILTLNANAQLN
ncbi:MAG: response regulator [Phormidesmis sp.]